MMGIFATINQRLEKDMIELIVDECGFKAEMAEEDLDKETVALMETPDDLIKGPDDNPTIGLLICSNKDETDVQYAFQGIQTPMGVASYTNVQIKEIQDQLPSVEELTKRIRLLEEQLSKKK